MTAKGDEVIVTLGLVTLEVGGHVGSRVSECRLLVVTGLTFYFPTRPQKARTDGAPEGYGLGKGKYG